MEAAVSLRVPLCGLPCSEIRIASCPEDWPRATGGCPACRAALAMPYDEAASPSVGGRPVSEAQALAAAAALLQEARQPFLFGLSLSGCGTARKAASIARRLGAALDVEGAEPLENDLRSLRVFGLASATFGEVSRRADVVLLWRCDPRADHPRLLPPRPMGAGSAERLFILAPPVADAAGEPGADTSSGRPAAEGASHLLPIAAGGDLDALLRLRAIACGRGPTAGGSATEAGGDPLADLRRAGEVLRRARYAAIVWDASATRGPAGVAIASTLALLTRDLNAQGRAAARPIGSGGNVAGAMSAILSDCGYPRPVGFAGGIPREAPEVFGATPMLQGGADALLLIGARSVAERGAAAVQKRGTVVIGPCLPEGCARPEVFIPTAVPALSERGLWVRADGFPVPMRAPVPPARPTEGEVLDRLLGRLAAARSMSPPSADPGSRPRAGVRKED